MFEASGLDATGVLAAAEANLRARRAAETDLLRIAAAWADLHPEEWMPPPVDEEEVTRRRLADEQPVQMGGPGSPKVIAFCPGELGLILETTYTGAKHLIADALDLRYRLPKLWATVQDGRVAAWKARRVAAATRTLTVEQAALVDESVHAVIATLGWARFELILDATLKRADPEAAQAAEEAAAARRFVAVGRANDHHIMTLIARGTSLDILSFMASVNRIADILHEDGDTDPVEIRRSKAIGFLARPAKALELLAKHQSPTAEDEPDPEQDGQTSLTLPLGLPGRRCECGPRIQLYVHLSETALSRSDPAGACRIEGFGPLTVATLRAWLGRTDVPLTVRPVLLPDQPAADSYEIPPAMREALRIRNPASAYPWSQILGRTLDVDHTRPYLSPDRGGPPGQTNLGNLGPFARREHRHKTFGHIKVRQAAPGVFLWRSRHGWIWLVTNTGTHQLGRGLVAQAIWDTAAQRLSGQPAERRETLNGGAGCCERPAPSCRPPVRRSTTVAGCGSPAASRRTSRP
jgi:hypothetical protein